MTEAHVVLLLGVLDGARFLQAQLDSLAAQTHENWSLLVSFDGSSDASREIVARFAQEHPEHAVQVFAGPGQGFARNFVHLLTQAPADADHIAFCDQDDVWLPQKISRQVSRLAPVEGAAMIFGRTVIVDEALREIAESPVFGKPPDFANALVQSMAGGNTMMFNRAALAHLRRAAAFAGAIRSHDWWAYQVLSGAGATVIYDREPTVLYRQHENNAVGENVSYAARMKRIGLVLGGRFRDWNDRAVLSLAPIRDELTAENRRVFDTFVAARRRGMIGRIRQYRALGLYRQTRGGQIALAVGFALGLI